MEFLNLAFYHTMLC